MNVAQCRVYLATFSAASIYMDLACVSDHINISGTESVGLGESKSMLSGALLSLLQIVSMEGTIMPCSLFGRFRSNTFISIPSSDLGDSTSENIRLFLTRNQRPREVDRRHR